MRPVRNVKPWAKGARPRVRAGYFWNFEPRVVYALYNQGRSWRADNVCLLTGGMPRMMQLEFVAGAMIAAAPVVVG